MKWKKREAELNRLRRKHPVLQKQMPRSLGSSSKYQSLSSTGISRICYGPRPSLKPPSGVIVDTLHKQGPMVLSRSELPWAGGKKP